MDRILSPPARVSRLDAEYPDAELMKGPLGVVNHLLGVGRHADRPLERNAGLRQSADQIVDRLIYRPAHRVIERRIERGAGHVICRRQIVEQSVNALDIENPLSNEARPADLLDHRDHRGIRVRRRMVWRERPDLASTDYAFSKDGDENRLAKKRAGRPGIVRSGGALALQAGLQIGDANLNAFDAHVSRVRSRAFRVFVAWQRLHRLRESTGPDRDGPAAQPGNRPRRQCRATENRS